MQNTAVRGERGRFILRTGNSSGPRRGTADRCRTGDRQCSRHGSPGGVGPATAGNAAPATTSNAAPPTGNFDTPSLAKAAGGQSVPATIASGESANPVPGSSTSTSVGGTSSSTNPATTGILAIASTVNAAGVDADDLAIGHSRYPWSPDSKGGSNATGDPSGTGSVDQFWSAASQQIVTGVILDMWI